MPVLLPAHPRAAIVTGAGGGLGSAIVKRLLDDGLDVAAWDWSEPALQRLALRHTPEQERLTCVVADVGDERSLTRALDQTMSRLGRLDVLVNNAGIPGPNLPLVEYPLDEWDAVLRVNLTGTFLCSKLAMAALCASAAGRIVNVASVAGKLASPGICAYAASKAGVISLTRGLARELAATAVRVNCVTPGAIKTEIFHRWPQDDVQGLVDKIPLGRFGEPEELAELVAWLASPACSFSTGAAFDLSGGRADA